jgi:NADH dehydrogenase (ubiquinone) Fe-S protein 1
MGYTSTPVNIKDLKFVYLLNADENIELIPKDAFVVYQGHHGDNGANRANVILPGCAYTEKSATYLNTEGRAQMTTKAVSAPAGARLDWKIIRALSQVHGTPLPYSDSDQIQSRMAQFSSRLVKLNTVHELQFTKEALLNLSNIKDTEVPFGEMEDFYQTNVISRASSTMAKCSKVILCNLGIHT